MTTPARPVPTSRRGPSKRPVTPHQLRALQLAANGSTQAAIASQLGIDDKSVGKLMTEIFRKLDARNVAHAVLLACRAGLLDGRPLLRHGDHAGYEAHRKRRIPYCEPCREGEKAYRDELKAKRNPEKAPESP
ncbi:helix-turn-helix transcriptional regulator [Streptomyces lavendulae]|uniref:response regulator transcription factor n=1 Tax=Streptomyces lavendulae TaxID=1914 RepID=UPI0033275941